MSTMKTPLTFQDLIIRLLDIVLALSLLVSFFWLFILIAIAIKTSDAGPIFFTQKRVGLSGKSFSILKFRTMKKPNLNHVVVQSHLEQHRVTKCGTFLRVTNLDEIPQLLNVLGGSMSMVGPRPHEFVQDEKFAKEIPEYATRRLIKPGITGLAQINGFVGPIVDREMIVGRSKLDSWMALNMSLNLYLNIIFKTVVIVVRRLFGRYTNTSF